MSFRPIYLPSKPRPTGGVGLSPTELPATEAYGPPRPRGAAGGKFYTIIRAVLHILDGRLVIFQTTRDFVK